MISRGYRQADGRRLVTQTLQRREGNADTIYRRSLEAAMKFIELIEYF